MSVSRIVKNIDNVAVYGNEYLSPYAINRNIKKLLENDQALYSFYRESLGHLRISDYNAGIEYDLGSLVWYTEPKTGRLYLLKNIQDKNINKPTAINGKFEKSGWVDEARYLDVLRYGICCELAQRAIDACEQHEIDSEKHPFGKISDDPDSDDYIDKKILRKDFTNLDSGRKTNMFPSYFKKMPASDSVINGTYRRWDCGIVEYDFTFKFNDTETTEETEKCACEILSADDCGCPDDNADISRNDLSANIVRFEETRDNPDIAEYFMNVNSDGRIFSTAAIADGYTGIVGRIRSNNRNNYVNTYSATIKFPVKFKNTNYMVYTNNVLCEVEDGSVKPSSNDLVICDKTRGSMTILNICYPIQRHFDQPSYNAQNGGLAANSFHCKIVGECT